MKRTQKVRFFLFVIVFFGSGNLHLMFFLGYTNLFI
jgi:hypothetical protein